MYAFHNYNPLAVKSCILTHPCPSQEGNPLKVKKIHLGSRAVFILWNYNLNEIIWVWILKTIILSITFYNKPSIINTPLYL